MLKDALSQIRSGRVRVTIESDGDNIVAVKKKYFAMVVELGRYAGYVSHKDRETFKTMIKEKLGNESISDMTEPSQVSVKIEELHQLAAEFYDYKFPSNDPDIQFIDP